MRMLHSSARMHAMPITRNKRQARPLAAPACIRPIGYSGRSQLAIRVTAKICCIKNACLTEPFRRKWYACRKHDHYTRAHTDIDTHSHEQEQRETCICL